MTKVTHRQVYRNSTFGGVVNTTLCGRVSNASDDYNIANDDDNPTCKLCARILKTPNHWRNRNIIEAR